MPTLQCFKKNKIYGLKGSYNHSTTHALIEITENNKQGCYSDEYACGVFLDLQKAFDTVNLNIILKKLCHYGVRGVPSNWFC